jgi:uncharacterized protein (DUF736 family)
MKSFIVTKINLEEGKEYTEKSPTHRLSVKDGEKWKEIGKCWTRDGSNGKFLSCMLSKPYMKYPGYSIVEEKAEPTIDPDSGIDVNEIGF